MIYTSGAAYQGVKNGAFVQFDIGIRGNEKLISGSVKFRASIAQLGINNLIGINGEFENYGLIYSGNNEYPFKVATHYYNEGTGPGEAIYSLNFDKIFLVNPTISIGFIPFVGINPTQLSYFGSLQIQTEGIE